MVTRRPSFHDVTALRQRESHKDTKDTERISKGWRLSLHPLCLCDGIELYLSHRPTMYIPEEPEQEYL
jgi:hypothetical protein